MRHRRALRTVALSILSALGYALLLWLCSGCAAQRRLTIHGLTSHERERVGRQAWNEVNPGLGVQQYVTDQTWVTAGGLENSYGDFASYAGVGVDFPKTLGVTTGTFVGAADYQQGVQPWAFVFARWGWMQVALAPDIGQYGGAVTTFSLSIPIR